MKPGKYFIEKGLSDSINCAINQAVKHPSGPDSFGSALKSSMDWFALTLPAALQHDRLTNKETIPFKRHVMVNSYHNQNTKPKHKLIGEVRDGKIIFNQPIIYIVKAGDTLSEISWNLTGRTASVQDLKNWNTIFSDTIQPGQALRLADPDDKLVKEAIAKLSKSELSSRNPSLNLDKLSPEMVVQYGGLLEGEYQVQIKLEYNEPWQQFLNPELSHQPEQEIPWAPGYSGGNGMGTSFDQVHYPDEVRLGGEDFKREVSESGDGFNWGIPIGAVGTAISAGTEYADNKVRTAFKTGRNPVSWSKLTPRQQAWRTANVLGKNAKYIKYAKGAGVIGTGVSVGMAGRDIFMGEGTMIDYFDVGVGTASLGAVIFLASNPVGWAIGSGAAIYFAGRLVYDFYEEIND